MTTPNKFRQMAERLVTKFNGEGAALSNSEETYLNELVESALRQAKAEGRREGLTEAVEWCMAFRRDDGTAQAIEEKLQALIQQSEVVKEYGNQKCACFIEIERLESKLAEAELRYTRMATRTANVCVFSATGSVYAACASGAAFGHDAWVAGWIGIVATLATFIAYCLGSKE